MLKGSFGTRVRHARKALGWSLATAARKTGVHQSAIWRIETGRRHARTQTAARIEWALGMASSTAPESDHGAVTALATNGGASQVRSRNAVASERAVSAGPNRPLLLDVAELRSDFRRLLHLSNSFPIFREVGATVRLKDRGLHVGDAQFGERFQITLTFDPFVDLGTIHVHQRLPDGKPMPPSLSDIETALKDREQVAFVLSDKTVFALWRETSGCHAEASHGLAHTYYQHYFEFTLLHHSDSAHVISRALTAAAAASARAAGYALYAGPLSTGRLSLVRDS